MVLSDLGAVLASTTGFFSAIFLGSDPYSSRSDAEADEGTETAMAAADAIDPSMLCRAARRPSSGVKALAQGAARARATKAEESFIFWFIEGWVCILIGLLRVTANECR